MNLGRFKQLLSAYGGRIEAWPVAEREAGRAFLHNHPELIALINHELSLDNLLDRLPTPVADLAGLKTHILNRTMRQHWFDQALGWLLPAAGRALWRPALAAMLPLVIGVILGTYVDMQGVTTDWQEDIEIMAFHDISEPLYE